MEKLADWFENETFWAEYAPIMFDTQRWAEAPTVAESILRIIGVPVDNAGISILDAGCGPGRIAIELAIRKAKVTGIDYSPLSVSKSREYNVENIKNGRCEIKKADVSDLKLPENKYDLATAFETVYFWPGIEKCFGEVYKVLAPGGTFLIVNEADGEDTSNDKWEKIIEGMKTYNKDELSEALKKAGFSEISCYHHDTKPWIAVSAKK